MDCQITVKRHAVPKGEGGLSHFQRNLLSVESRLRIGAAPTGSGKSYVFLQAVLMGKRILFIVPTRRLANNLVASLLEDMRNAGWSQAQIVSKVALWTSDGKLAAKVSGVTNVTQQRLDQIGGLSPRPGGEIVVATPESVAWLIMDSRRFASRGYADRSILNVIADFDHLVFDEMHTIEPRGLSLSLVMAWLCIHFPAWDTKLSYLSATPIDLRLPLRRFGIAPEHLTVLNEQIEDLNPSAPVNDDQRVIHGDVSIEFHEGAVLSELVYQQRESVLNEVKAGRQIVLIYDRLFDGLSRDIQSLERNLIEMGLNPHKVLLISSADDSQQGNTDAHSNFRAGSQYEPEQFDFLVATSSIEIGVTFNCRLLFMDPGHDEASFQQRFGRVSRGDYPGQVHIAWRSTDVGRHLWIRSLIKFARRNHSERLSISELTTVLTQRQTHRFASPSEATGMFAENIAWYDQMPGRAAAIAGLVWHYLKQHHGLKGARARLLYPHTPPIAEQMAAMLRPLEELAQVPDYADTAQAWIEAFKEEVLTLRTIGRLIRVISPDGVSWQIPWRSVERYTDLLARYRPEQLESGEWQLRIEEEHFRQAQLEEANRIQPRRVLLLPHDGRHFPVPPNQQPYRYLVKVLHGICSAGTQPVVVEQALKALIELTRQTQLVCLDELD